MSPREKKRIKAVWFSVLFVTMTVPMVWSFYRQSYLNQPEGEVFWEIDERSDLNRDVRMRLRPPEDFGYKEGIQLSETAYAAITAFQLLNGLAVPDEEVQNYLVWLQANQQAREEVAQVLGLENTGQLPNRRDLKKLLVDDAHST